MAAKPVTQNTHKIKTTKSQNRLTREQKPQTYQSRQSKHQHQRQGG